MASIRLAGVRSVASSSRCSWRRSSSGSSCGGEWVEPRERPRNHDRATLRGGIRSVQTSGTDTRQESSSSAYIQTRRKGATSEAPTTHIWALVSVTKIEVYSGSLYVRAHTSPLGTVSIRLDRQRAEQNAASYARYTSCPRCMIRLAHAAFAHTACFSCRRSEAKPTPRCRLDH